MNAVAGVGEPWYTSGVHMWNGTAATLKPSPTISRAKPASSRPFVRAFTRKNSAMIPRLGPPKFRLLPSD